MQTPAFKLVSALALLSALALPAYAADSDGDGVDDAIDNCISKSNTDQRDTDNDGIGNLCDGDLNNDGKVNSLDLGLFKKKLGTTDADSDFNGDGVVNAADTAILQQGINKDPGPTAVKNDPLLAASPPQVAALDIASLNTPLADGRNAALFLQFADGQAPGNTVVIWPTGKPVPLNDLGIAPDQAAGDKVFSGFASLDLNALDSQEAVLANRIAAASTPNIGFFSNRELLEMQAFQAGRRASVFDGGTVSLPSSMTLKALPNLTSAFLPVTFDKSKVLMVNATNVVADPTLTFDPCNTGGTGNNANPNAAWSFKTLLGNMSSSPGNPAVVRQFIHDWLINWQFNQTVNLFTVPARPAIQTLGLFPGWDGVNAATLNVNALPFRLLAIVNRMDLGKSSPYGGSNKAGETRFVFGLLQSCSPAPMTVILEYGDTGASCTAQKTRANSWIALDSLTLGSPAYMTALKALTDTVTLPNAAPSKTNGSALNQLRTNEIALTGSSWDFREFVLDSGSLSLRYDTLKQTPNRTAPASFNFNPSLTLDKYMEANANDILCEKYTVPLSVPLGYPLAGQRFRAGSIEYNATAFWNWTIGAAPTLPVNFPSCHVANATFSGPPPTFTEMKSEVRHKFSLNTCDDCHARETNTFFTHVDPSSSYPAQLSGFLAGVPGPTPTLLQWPVSDPAGSSITRKFNDLQRRGQILQSLSTQSCLGIIDAGSFATQQAAMKLVH